MSSIYKGCIRFGSKDLDGSEIPQTFYWGSLISSNPKDADGKPVSNPASFYVYGANKHKETGDIEQALLLTRGAEGLYDYVPKEHHSKVLAQLVEGIEDFEQYGVDADRVREILMTRGTEGFIEPLEEHRQVVYSLLTAVRRNLPEVPVVGSTSKRLSREERKVRRNKKKAERAARNGAASPVPTPKQEQEEEMVPNR